MMIHVKHRLDSMSKHMFHVKHFVDGVNESSI